MKLAIFLLACVACANVSATPLYSLSLNPSNGTVSGLPGTAVGWGFTLTDTDPSNWVLLTDSSFTGSTVNGTYVDYLATQFFVAGPAPEQGTLTVPWNRGALAGTGEFDINSTASPGPIPGNIVVHYSVFSQDPNDPAFNPDGSFVASGTFTLAAQATVTPEPATFLLLLVPLAFVLARRPRATTR
jgi:hypothetical protein